MSTNTTVTKQKRQSANEPPARHSGAIRGFIADGTRNPLSSLWLGESGSASTIGPWLIPPTWRWSTMGEEAMVVGGGTPKTSRPDYFGGDIPWITPADLSGYTEKYISAGARNITQVGLENSGAKLMPAGTVLFSSRAPIGYVAVAANIVSTNQGFKSFVLKDGLTPDFVYYYLQHAKRLALELASGTTFQEISGKNAARLPVPVPPIHDQIRVVAEIEKQFTRLDAGVAALRLVHANLKRYRAAVLKAACEGRLVPTEAELAKAEGRIFESGEQLLARILTDRRKNWQGRGKCKEPAVPDTTNLPPLPEGWAWASVEQLAEIGSGNTPAKISDYAKPAGAVPWFKVGDMNRVGNEQIMRSAEAYLRHEDVQALGLRLFPSGTIVFPKRGGAIATNKKRLLEASATTDLNVMGLTPDVRVFGYFKHWFASIDLASLSDGSNVPQVNNKDIQPLLSPLPPLSEQTRIVAEVERRLSVVEELQAAVAANLQRTTRLRQSILQRAFGDPARLNSK